MPYNGNGLFNRVHNWVQDKANAILINASRMDEEFDGIATGLSTCIAKDGQTTIVADLPMAGFKHTGVGNAAARNQYATVAQVQDGGYVHATSGGSANAYTLTVSPAITAYAAGQTFTFKANHANTGAATLAVSGLAAKAIQLATVALTGGEIPINAVATVIYDGTQFQLASVGVFGDGTVSLPGIAFGQDTNTGFYRAAADQVAVALGGVQTALLTASGVTFSQAGNDTAILSRASSDVSHGRTDLAPTTVYGWDQKIDAALGGLQISGISDAVAGYALRMVGYADTPDTTHTTAAVGIVEAYAATVTGTGINNLAADNNVFVAKGRIGGAWTAEFIIDAEGELFARSGGVSPTDFDAYDDAVLVRAFNDFLGMDRSKPDFGRMDRLADLRFMGRITPEQWQQGERPLWCVTKVVQLHNGWMVQAVERERIRDEIIEEMLPGFLAKVAERAIGQNVGAIPALMEK